MLNNFTRSAAVAFIWELKQLLMRVGFRPNIKKTAIVPPGARKIVLGVLVDGSKPRLTREFRSKLRQHLYYLETLGPIEHAKSRNFETVWGMRRHIRGLIDYANMVDKAYAAPILKRFELIHWP